MIPPIFLYALLTPVRLGLRLLGWLLAHLYIDPDESDHFQRFDPRTGQCGHCDDQEIADAIPTRYPKVPPSTNGDRQRERVA